jgi:hypothetical protein
MGLVEGLEHRGTCQGTKKGRPVFAGPPDCVVFVGYLEYRGNQVGGKTPEALALVTACVRLWTPSLRANIYSSSSKPKRCACATAWVRLLTPSLP